MNTERLGEKPKLGLRDVLGKIRGPRSPHMTQRDMESHF